MRLSRGRYCGGGLRLWVFGRKRKGATGRLFETIETHPKVEVMLSGSLEKGILLLCYKIDMISCGRILYRSCCRGPWRRGSYYYVIKLI